MDILIIANFCDDFSTVNNDRFIYLANMLSAKHSVEVLTSDFYHTEKRKREDQITACGFNVTFLHEPGYKRNVCLKRFYSHYIWGRNVRKYLKDRPTPDVIYCAVPSLTAAYNVSRFCRKNNIRFVIDIQDLWPEAFQMIVNVPLISKLLFLPFTFVANLIYKSADSVCAVSQTYLNRGLLVNEKCKSGVSVFLGTNLSDFDKNVEIGACNLIEPGKKRLAYCGTLGSSYNLSIVFDALSVLSKGRKKVPQFIVMGSGPRYEEFKEYAERLKIDVVFVGRLPYDEMCSLLASCDIAVNPITQGAAQSIINKHADYAAAGLPVINTQKCGEYQSLIESYCMGINCESANDVACAIEELILNDDLREKMGHNARRCAREKFDRSVTYRFLVDEILKK